MSISPQMWAHARSVEFHHKKHKSSILKGKLKDRPTFCKRMVIHLLDTNWPQSEKGFEERQCTPVGQGIPGSSGCSQGDSTLLTCGWLFGSSSSRTLVFATFAVQQRISAVQLLCSSQLTKTGTTRTEVDLSGPLSTISHSP